jgi:hypothetical protein
MRLSRADVDDDLYGRLFERQTRLPRAALVKDRIGMALARAQRERRRVGVLVVCVEIPLEYESFRSGRRCLDLHALIAGRLRSVVRPDDTVGTLGSQRYVLVCNSMKDHVELEQIADRLRNAITARVYFDDVRPALGTRMTMFLTEDDASIDDVIERISSSR